MALDGVKVKSDTMYQAGERTAHSRRGAGRLITTTICYTFLIILCLTTLFPFFWMISSSFKPETEIIFFKLLPIEPTLANYVRVLTQYPFLRWYCNSIVVTVITVLSNLLLGSMAAYALAKFRFKGRDLFFLFILSTLMVPSEMLIIPWYAGASALNIDNSYLGVVFPGLVGAFSVFLLRQAILTVPNDLMDAARVDGMSEFGIFFRIVIPLISGSLIALGLLMALTTWNDYLWPLIITRDVDMYTLQVGITYAAQTDIDEYGAKWTITMASTTIACVPMLLLIVAAQKHFVKGIALTGLKG